MERVTLDETAPFPLEFRHVALGFFDGLHLGHRAVILNPASRDTPEATAVVSFWPHPLTVLRPDQAPPLLTDRNEKNQLLESWGLGAHAVVPFDDKTAHQPPEWLLRLLERCFPHLESLSVGPNFRFGLKRAGSPLTLSQWCQEKNIQFHLTDFVLDQGMPISSSRIRQCLASGDLITSNRLLGHEYQLAGEVVAGAKQGRRLGFPTANLAIQKTNILPHGVYAARACLPDTPPQAAALNIGLRPTINSSSPELSIEAHLLDWDGDCYGQFLTLKPVHYLRPEKRFRSREELITQIASDVNACREFL